MSSSVAPRNKPEHVSPEQVFDFIFLNEKDPPKRDEGWVSSPGTTPSNDPMLGDRLPLKTVSYVLAGAFFLLAVLVIVGLTVALVIQNQDESDINTPSTSSPNTNLREVFQSISWGPWGDWSRCNQPCSGFRKRNRSCLSDPGPCAQQSKNSTWELETCPSDQCNEEGLSAESSTESSPKSNTESSTEISMWSDWVDQTNCSVSCGSGTKTQTRRCQGLSCPGVDQSLQRTTNCNAAEPCGTWSSWSEWGECSVSCGKGVTVAQRNCKNINAETSSFCEGDSNQTRPCEQDPCPNPILCGPMSDGSKSQEQAIRWARQTTNPDIELRVVGGTDALLNEFPWQASIEKRQTQRTRYHPFCGGVLMSELWVMTAAHCTFGILNHPEYNEVNVDFDIALLRLSQAVNFEEFPHIRPICFPSAHPDPGEEVVLAGWGREAENAQNGADVLQKAKLPVLSREDCLSYYRGLELTPRMFCAGYKTGGQDSCQGDSGGPLILKKSSNYEVVGLVSYGLKDCGAGPAVYTKVTELKTWWRPFLNSTEYPRTAK
ncbi:plasma kallikrein-like isoform X2 [Tigriopus californicus]|uniref:plasma kallikrein-like isoform X2 n=1 Tax=Tigriopus californicus TaxID=6832 RepID=UPI0027DA6BBC|nr:plasma kallikrein-like isoform X2 [Tigriopus californicus]